jgi:hypothetical protein
VTEAGETTVAPNLDTPDTPLFALRSEWLRGDNSPDADVDVRMHPLTLRFDDEDLESEFEEEYFRGTIAVRANRWWTFVAHEDACRRGAAAADEVRPRRASETRSRRDAGDA